MQLAVSALLVDAELELDLLLVRIGELVDGDDIVGKQPQLLLSRRRDMRENEDDYRVRGARLAQRVDENSKRGNLM